MIQRYSTYILFVLFSNLIKLYEFKAFIHWELFTLQKVEVGLQLQALKLLSEATRKADEELQSYSPECVESSSITETYMTLANFCDKRLREEEQSDTGEW